MREISLTQGQVAKVSDSDFEYYNQWKWFAYLDKDTHTYYAARNETFYREDGSKYRRLVYMHRDIMNTPKNLKCDHKNHDTLDNQRHNLRNCTNSQNIMNQIRPQSRNKTGVLGVFMYGGKYRAFIHINKKQKQFPSRDTLEEAMQDRKNAEIVYYGEFRGDKS